MQIRVTIGNDFIPTGMLESKDHVSVEEYIEKLEHLYAAGESIKWQSPWTVDW
jgi:hypothetical protein